MKERLDNLVYLILFGLGVLGLLGALVDFGSKVWMVVEALTP